MDLNEDYKIKAEKMSRLLIKRIQKGTLTKDYFNHIGFSNGSPLECVTATMARWATREIVTDKCSWFLITERWLSGIRKLVQGNRVVEVCSGTGVLGPLMRERGIDWVCTDMTPGGKHVTSLDGLDTDKLLELRPDVIFAGWIPYELQLDISLAETKLPLVIVGEFGGCTGSYEFREHEACKSSISPVEVHPNFEDIPTWEGIHDHTMLFNWK